MSFLKNKKNIYQRREEKKSFASYELVINNFDNFVKHIYA